MMSNSWLLGFETDFAGADIHGQTGSSATYGCGLGSCDSNIDWFGTVRGRVGYAVNNLLFYGTGGLAYGEVKTLIENAPNFLGTTTRTGWTAGGGLEWMFAPSWTAKVEYLHVDLGHFGFGTGIPLLGGTSTPTPQTKSEFDTVKAGINYHFDWGKAPVVATY